MRSFRDVRLSQKTTPFRFFETRTRFERDSLKMLNAVSVFSASRSHFLGPTWVGDRAPVLALSSHRVPSDKLRPWVRSACREVRIMSAGAQLMAEGWPRSSLGTESSATRRRAPVPRLGQLFSSLAVTHDDDNVPSTEASSTRSPAFSESIVIGLSPPAEAALGILGLRQILGLYFERHPAQAGGLLC